MKVDITRLIRKIRKNLTPDLLDRKYKPQFHRMSGHCYVASEVLWHLLGGVSSGWKPMQVRHEETSHWYLQNKETGEILDVTADQFVYPVPYAEGRGRGFLTSKPSKRALILMERIAK